MLPIPKNVSGGNTVHILVEDSGWDFTADSSRPQSILSGAWLNYYNNRLAMNAGVSIQEVNSRIAIWRSRACYS
jgi:hypothetical protein